MRLSKARYYYTTCRDLHRPYSSLIKIFLPPYRRDILQSSHDLNAKDEESTYKATGSVALFSARAGLVTKTMQDSALLKTRLLMQWNALVSSSGREPLIHSASSECRDESDAFLIGKKAPQELRIFPESNITQILTTQYHHRSPVSK